MKTCETWFVWFNCEIWRHVPGGFLCTFLVQLLLLCQWPMLSLHSKTTVLLTYADSKHLSMLVFRVFSFLVDICRCVFRGSHVILWFVASIMTCFPFTMNVNPALGSLGMGNSPMTSIIVFGKASWIQRVLGVQHVLALMTQTFGFWQRKFSQQESLLEIYMHEIKGCFLIWRMVFLWSSCWITNCVSEAVKQRICDSIATAASVLRCCYGPAGSARVFWWPHRRQAVARLAATVGFEEREHVWTRSPKAWWGKSTM